MFLHKSQRVEGFFNKYNRTEGVMGKSALSPSFPRAEEQGRGTALTGGGQSGRPSHGGGRERAGKGEGVVVG